MSQRIPNGSSRKILIRAKRQRLLAAYHRSGLTQKAFAQRHGCAADLATLAHDPAFHKALAAVVDGVNADLAQIEKIRRFAIAPQPFSTENQMMTPTLKIRRHVIRAQYGDVLEKLYARSG